MGTCAGGRTRSPEDQIWDYLARIGDAGPVADAYLAAQERQAWAARETGRSATSGPGMIVVIATVCRRWIGLWLIAVGGWLAGDALVQNVDDRRFLPLQRRLAS
jgi:hypothetical protein